MRKSTHRSAFAAILPTSIALAAAIAAPLASAADVAKPSAAGCREEARRVAVWPSGNPKILQIVRFETKTVTICDGKIVAQASNEKDERGK